ncbi:phosphatase PAP2 family protein [Xylophilus sp. Kf1]|nr:phosphatase PAP2 family protein [Xylophilus sp. Kf1]
MKTWPFALLPATVFAVLATHLGTGSPLQRWDEWFSQAVGLETPQAVRQALALLTHLGDPPVLWAFGAVVALALLARRHHALAVTWVCALLGNGLLNRALKDFFVRARPLIDGLPGPEHGYSFPSGHSSASLVAYGMLAWLAWHLAPRWRWPLTIVVSMVVLLVASSRVVLQVHFASDVVAGLCSGLTWALLCTGAAAWHRDRTRLQRQHRDPAR